MTRFVPLFDEGFTPEEQDERLSLILHRLKAQLITYAKMPLPPEECWSFLLLPGRTEQNQLVLMEQDGGHVMRTSIRGLNVVRFSPAHISVSLAHRRLNT